MERGDVEGCAASCSATLRSESGIACVFPPSPIRCLLTLLRDCWVLGDPDLMDRALEALGVALNAAAGAAEGGESSVRADGAARPNMTSAFHRQLSPAATAAGRAVPLETTEADPCPRPSCASASLVMETFPEWEALPAGLREATARASTAAERRQRTAQHQKGTMMEGGLTAGSGSGGQASRTAGPHRTGARQWESQNNVEKARDSSLPFGADIDIRGAILMLFEC
jgi:hypothetical protein